MGIEQIALHRRSQADIPFRHHDNFRVRQTLADGGVCSLRGSKCALMHQQNVLISHRHNIVMKCACRDGLRGLFDEQRSIGRKLMQPGNGAAGLFMLASGKGTPFWAIGAFAINEDFQTGLPVV